MASSDLLFKARGPFSHISLLFAFSSTPSRRSLPCPLLSFQVVEDKTFGLKNKNKSKKVQQYVAQVQKDAKFVGRSREEVLEEERRKAERQALKKAKSEAGLLQSTLMNFVPTVKTAAGADPKSTVCEHFMRGRCSRGKKCPFLHDSTQERKAEKINIYEDPRQKDTMDQWDQSKLEAVIGQKQAGRMPPTDIVCKYFLDAIEKSMYGWFWECPNGVTCHYRHALPPGYVFKPSTKKTMEDSKEEVVDISELIEEERKKLDLSKCTKVTPETFAAWKEKRQKERDAKIETERQEAAKKSGNKGINVLSGRALFQFDPTLFQDDENAADEYVIEEREEEAEDQGVGVALDEMEEEKDDGMDGADGVNDEDDEDDDSEEEDGDEAVPEVAESKTVPPSTSPATATPTTSTAAPAAVVPEKEKKEKKDKKDKKDKDDKKDKEDKKDKKEKKEKKDKKEKSPAGGDASVVVDESLFADDDGDDVPDE